MGLHGNHGRDPRYQASCSGQAQGSTNSEKAPFGPNNS